MKVNKYKLVHMIAKDAEENEIKSRDMLNDANVYSSLTQKREKRNFVKESYDRITEELKNDGA